VCVAVEQDAFIRHNVVVFDVVAHRVAVAWFRFACRRLRRKKQMSEFEEVLRGSSWISHDSSWREVSDKLKKEPAFEALSPEVSKRPSDAMLFYAMRCDVFSFVCV
jgi:hypothetical protein